MLSSPFFGIRFFLSGFPPPHHDQVRSQLVSVGAIDAAIYGPNCTHVIVHDSLIYDDPICVKARKDGKALVTSLWVDHSLEAGEPIDTDHILYRPLKDKNGIPGAKDLVICLTGYRSQDRLDIMLMVDMMGAVFSKSLTPNQNTHLVCYKNEGEKYDVAKRCRNLKIVNHYWLEDSLKAWKLLPEEQYSKSGYELEMMEAEVKDSEETENATVKLNEGRNSHAVPTLQNVVGGNQQNPVTSCKESSPSSRQALSNTARIENVALLVKEEKQSDQTPNSRSLKKLNQQSSSHGGAQCLTNANSVNMHGHCMGSLLSHQVGNLHPSTAGNAECREGSTAEEISGVSKKTPIRKSSVVRHDEDNLETYTEARLKSLTSSDAGKCSPSGTRNSSRGSGKSGGSGRKLQKNSEVRVINDLHHSNPAPDKGKDTSVFVGVLNPEQPTSTASDKRSPPSSSKTSRRSSISCENAGKSGNSGGILCKLIGERAVDACASTATPAKGSSSLTCDVPNVQASSASNEDQSCVLPQKRKIDCQSDGSHVSPKSLRLDSSASKRIDATEPISAYTPIMKSNNLALNFESSRGDGSAKPSYAESADVTSVESKAKSAAASKYLASEKLKSSKSTNVASIATLNISGAATSTSSMVENEKPGLHNQHDNGYLSPGTKELEINKSASPKQKSDDQTGSSVSKPTRKKSVARKTLGSRPKFCKPTGTAQQGASRGNSGKQDLSMHIVVQMEEDHEKCHSADQLKKASPAKNASPDVCRTLLKSCNETNDAGGLLDDETEPPPELSVQNEKTGAVDLSHKALAIEVNASPSDKSWGQETPVLEAGNKKKKLMTSKKGITGRTKKKNALDMKDKANKANEPECIGLAERPSNTSARPVVEKKVSESITGNDQGASKGGKRVGMLAGRKRRSPTEDEIEKVRVLDTGCEEKNEFRKLSAESNSYVRPLEVKEAEPTIKSGEGASKVGKPTAKMAAKKRLAGKKQCSPSEDEIENVQVLGTVDEEKNESAKLSTESNSHIRPLVVGEAEQIIRTDEGTSKGGKPARKVAAKKRRGTLLLNKPDSVVEVEKDSVPVLGGSEGTSNDERQTESSVHKSDMNQVIKDAEKENDPSVDNKQRDSNGSKCGGRLKGKKRRGTLVLNNSVSSATVEKENQPLDDGEGNGVDFTSKSSNDSHPMVRKDNVTDVNTRALDAAKQEPACYLLSGHRLQRKEFQQIIKRLKGKVCRDSHQWSYQATHLVVPDPLRRTEKFFAAAASGRWILKTDYLTACSQAGKFLSEEPYEWHKNGLNEDGAINLEAPRKWRLLRERKGHGAFYGMRIVIYGECIAPPLDTLKRVVKGGDGTILATSPPYTRFLDSGVDYAIVSPGMPRVDVWVQEFLRHEIPCVLADYLVEYVCKPGYSLEKHVQYSTHAWAAKSFAKLTSLSEECISDVASPDNQSDNLACDVCGCTDRGEEILVCGDESGSVGCGIGTHLDCCDPPLEDIPEEDWFCPKCTESRNYPPKGTMKKATSKKQR